MEKSETPPSADNVLKFFVELFDLFSDFFTRIGEIEKKFGVSFEVFQKEKGKELINLISPEMPPDQLGHFFKFLLLTVKIGYDFQNVYKIPADKKIETGNKLKEIVREFERSFSEMKGE